MTTSDMLEDDQLSILLMKNGEKVVTGTQSGVLNIWSWGKVQNYFVLFFFLKLIFCFVLFFFFEKHLLTREFFFFFIIFFYFIVG